MREVARASGAGPEFGRGNRDARRDRFHMLRGAEPSRMARHQERKSRAGGVAGTALAPGVERRAPQLRGGEPRRIAVGVPQACISNSGPFPRGGRSPGRRPQVGGLFVNPIGITRRCHSRCAVRRGGRPGRDRSRRRRDREEPKSRSCARPVDCGDPARVAWPRRARDLIPPRVSRTPGGSPRRTRSARGSPSRGPA